LQRLIIKFPDFWPQEVFDRTSMLPNLTIDLAEYVEPPFDEIVDHLADIRFRISERTLRRYHVALKTRGFVILAGPSGTGKTWLTKAYADAVDAEHCIVSVAPNWTANEDLMGFFNPVSQVFHDTEFTRFLRQAADEYHVALEAGAEARPYHLVLDEMNLARVEYYFASFLSAMETRARNTTATMRIGPDLDLELTPNLKVIGTVNIDETTHGFADKVYDRAQLLALDVTLGEIEQHVAGMSHGHDVIEIWKIVSQYKPFAFRVLDEIATYIQESERIGVAWDEALDEQILSKVLPRLNGHDVIVGTVLQELTEYLLERFPLSHSRAQRMSHDHSVHGFTSYFG
jgi:energy-coupling factor transporter ATP-binding protein EcfA2